MKRNTALLAAIAASVLAPMLHAQAPASPESPSHTDQRLERLERRFDEMEKQHREELQARDAEIARLKQALEQYKPATVPAGTSSPGAGVGAGVATAPAAHPPAIPPADEIDRTTQAILNDAQRRSASPLEPRKGASAAPDIAVIGDAKGNIARGSADNPARNRFDLSSVELDLRAAVDPRADAVVILPVVREMEDPLFFDPANPPEGGIETAIEVEEAYLHLHDLSLENLQAKIGRFHAHFGRWNLLHAHNWPTVDNAYVIQSFFGPEAYADSGLSLSYVIPPAATFGEYVQLTGEILTGEGGEEAPVINNDAYVDNPATNLHLLWNRDLTRDWNLELGASWLRSNRNNASDQVANLYGLDLTLVHQDPTGRFNNQVIGAEAIFGDIDIADEEGTRSNSRAWGGYVFAQQQLNRDWYLGCRLDYTQDALDSSREVWGIAPYVTWYWNEFLRFRLEYQHKEGDTPTEEILWFQASFVFGAHPPHPYWAMK